MFGVGKVSAMNVLRKNPLNYLGKLDALPEVIAEEANTFVARCYGDKNSVDMAEIRFGPSTNLPCLYSDLSKKTMQNRVTLIIFGGKYSLGIVIPPILLC